MNGNEMALTREQVRKGNKCIWRAQEANGSPLTAEQREMEKRDEAEAEAEAEAE